MNGSKPPKLNLDTLQKLSLSLMAVFAVLTFAAANLQAVLWQSSEWLVSTVLPAVVIELTNDERADIEQTPLVRNATLDEAARQKAKHMARYEYFSHYSPDGVSPWHWFDESGYEYAHAGENLAIHFTDSSEVVEAWMRSPAHRDNIVSGKYTEIGVGTAKGEFEGYETVYVVQLFGTPGIAPTQQIAPAPQESPELARVTEPSPAVTAAESQDIETVEDVQAVAVEQSQAEAMTEIPASQPATEEPAAELLPLSEGAPLAANDAAVESEVSPVEIVNQQPVREMTTPLTESESDVVVIESTLIATSSGLAVANYVEPAGAHAGGTMASVITQPNLVLQVVYFFLGLLILSLLTASIVMEARQLHYVQVGYSFALLFAMGGLWFVHTLLTEGAVII